MYIGDGSDNSLKVFDAHTGSFMGTLVKSQGGLHGPRGLLIFEGGNLLVSDQNIDTSTNGDISLYDSATGKLLNRVVSHDEPNAPAVPRGIITFTHSRTDIFVADFSAETQEPNKLATPGRVRAYTAAGEFIGDLTPPNDLVPPDHYHPRGLVIGPDGKLYVANRPGTGLGGDVLRFDPLTREFIDVFIHDTGGDGHLNGPEGICFGPDGKLYMISFRFSENDKDTVRIYQGPRGASHLPGTFIDAIDLDVVGLPAGQRAFAQTLLFGPDGQLFVPINGDGPDTGSVRRYNVATKLFEVFVPAAAKGGPLGQPWYPTFGETNPSTLNYPPRPK
jgi:DNA-binding beta-propeller fold protein YncE